MYATFWYLSQVICCLDDDDDDKKLELKKMKEEAFERLAEDISMVDDDHLDLTLEEEEIFLNEYLSLLQLE